MKINPWLLLTASPPGHLGVGQLYVRSLCRLLPPQSVAVAALLGPGEAWTPPGDLDLADHLRLERRFETAYRPRRGMIGETAAAAGVRFRLMPHACRLVDETVMWSRDRGVGGLMVVLDSPLTMLMAAKAATRLRVPLHTLVWDAPEHVLGRFGHSAWSERYLQEFFDAALRKSAGVAVLSDAMQRRFAADYGARCTIVRQPIETIWTAAPLAARRQSSEDFVIGFAGSVTARDEMELLCRTLDAEDWMIAGRRVRLRVFGLRFVCQAQAARWIEYRGYLPDVADVVTGLRECDALFLPQPFSAVDRPFSEYSFPTKFTTYLAAGRPIVLLAPAWSALAVYCRQNDLPIVCDQADPIVLREHLRRIAADQNHVCDLELRLQTVAEQFRPQRMREHVDIWLTTDASSVGADSGNQSPDRVGPALPV